ARTAGGGTVFTTCRGKPIDSRDFAKRDWRRLLSAAGLAHRSPEQLRHTAATLMLAAGEAPTYIARVLGHADIQQLLTTYARFMPDALGQRDGSRMQAALQGYDSAPLARG
ncbi:MAG: tyrosine-type recombinase/integrase, partial [Pseudoxanthomonas suwonensis]|nr:tyrosine-type recombinase/integrase [Pseudoxanthomonas suwonensis]